MSPLTRRQLSDTVGALGWRLVLGAIYTEVLAPSMSDAVAAASHAVAAAGRDAARHLAIDIRADRAVLRLRSADSATATERDLELAQALSQALAARGFELTTGGAVQAVEIAIDALDIAAVRPFWKAITDYEDEPGPSDSMRAWSTLRPWARDLVSANGFATAATQSDPPRHRRPA